jgi:methionyl-tRNA formyltransferase
MRMAASAVAQAAEARGIPLFKPETLRDPQAQATLAAQSADVMVVAAFGLILPAGVLAIPRLGCINIHASLLPRWRGAAPIQRAILAGDTATGITIMRMDAGLDTGPALLTRPHPIGPRDTAGALTEALAALGAASVVEALARLESLVPQPQDAAQATYAAKIGKAEARIDWSLPAVLIDRQVRAYDPAPGAETQFEGAALKVWKAEPVDRRGAPGEVLEAAPEGIVVGCGQRALRLLEVQRAGAKRLSAGPFLLGTPLKPGRVLGEAAQAAPAKPAA